MQTLKSFLDQSLVIWKDSTAAARFGIILMLVMCLGTIVGVGIWSAQSNYISLATDLDPQEATQLMAALDSANISHRIKGGGRMIQVDEGEFALARVIAGKAGVDDNKIELETGSPWMDPLARQELSIRNKELQLSTMVAKMDPVESATVKLSIPEKQPFMRDRFTTTASVMVKVAPGKRFGDSEAATVATQIAGGVPGLVRDNVVVTDVAGNLYSFDETMAEMSKQEEFRFFREQELVDKAQSILNRIVGDNNSEVKVTASFAFPNEEKVSVQFDPDKKVVTREKVDSTEKTTPQLTSVGAAGTESNVRNGGRGAGKKLTTEKSENLESEYEISQTTLEETVRTPVLQKLNVSVAVNPTALQDENGVIAPEKKARIEALIQNAVGYRLETDEITIVYEPFADQFDVEAVPSAPIPWDQINSILKNISLGIAALVALFLGLKAIKGLVPLQAPGGAAAQLGGEQASQVNQLSEMVKENPEVFSKIIANWASDPSDSTEEDPQSKAA